MPISQVWSEFLRNWKNSKPFFVLQNRIYVTYIILVPGGSIPLRYQTMIRYSFRWLKNTMRVVSGNYLMKIIIWETKLLVSQYHLEFSHPQFLIIYNNLNFFLQENLNISNEPKEKANSGQNIPPVSISQVPADTAINKTGKPLFQYNYMCRFLWVFNSWPSTCRNMFGRCIKFPHVPDFAVKHLQ